MQTDGTIVKVNINEAVLPGNGLFPWKPPSLHQRGNTIERMDVFGQLPFLHENGVDCGHCKT